MSCVKNCWSSRNGYHFNSNVFFSSSPIVLNRSFVYKTVVDAYLGAVKTFWFVYCDWLGLEKIKMRGWDRVKITVRWAFFTKTVLASFIFFFLFIYFFILKEWWTGMNRHTHEGSHCITSKWPVRWWEKKISLIPSPLGNCDTRAILKMPVSCPIPLKHSREPW